TAQAAGDTRRADAETPSGERDAADGETASSATPVGERDATPTDASDDAAAEAPADAGDGPAASGATPAGDGDAMPDARDARPGDGGEYTPAPVRDGDPLATHTNGSPDGNTDGDAATRDYDTWRGQAANGHDDSILRPVERRP
ncbi:MAG TPA: hypothetical protein VI300_10385, partial [Solirubrobacter sp.]